MNPYFSINDANNILPSVIKKFNYAKKMKADVMKLEQQLASSVTPVTSLEEYTIIKRKLNSCSNFMISLLSFFTKLNFLITIVKILFASLIEKYAVILYTWL